MNPVTIDKGFGREVVVDVVNPKGMVPLGFEIDDPARINYRIMQHGPFGIKIRTTALADVLIQLDGTLLLAVRINPGVSVLNIAADGLPLTFSPSGPQTLRMPVALDQLKDPGQPIPEDEYASEGAPVEKPVSEIDTLLSRELAPSKGLLMVHVRMASVTMPGNPPYPPDTFTPVLFQLNPSREHFKALAKLVHKMVAPPKLDTITEFVNPDGSPGEPIAIEPRLCSVCND